MSARFFCPTWIIFVKIECSDKGFSVWGCDFVLTITVNNRIYCLLMVLWAEFSETGEMKERCLFYLFSKQSLNRVFHCANSALFS